MKWTLDTLCSTDRVTLPDVLPRSLTSVTPRQARLGLAQAWQSLLALDIGRALALAGSIELGVGDLPSAVADEIRREIGLLRAAGLALQDDGPAALAAATTRHGRGALGASVAQTVCRFGYRKLADLDSFYAVPRKPPGASLGRRQAMAAVFDLAIEAAVAFEQLRVAASKRLALDAMDLSAAVSDVADAPTLPAALVAQALYEQGHLDEAESLLGDHLPAIKARGDIESALRAYPLLARIAARRGRRDFAMLLLHEAEDLGQRRGWARLVAAAQAERIGLLLEDGRLGEAEACAGRMERGRFRPELERHSSLARARLALARAPSPAPLARLRELRHDALTRHDLHGALQLSVLLADALDIVGMAAEATALLLQALHVGCTAGLYQLFLDGGPRIGRLLTLAYEHAQAADDGPGEVLAYIDSLYTGWRANGPAARPPKATPRPGGLLSARERDILLLIGRGLSNKGIAQALRIAPETVKSHAKHIFIKLEVKTRAEAVSRAGTLGILHDHRRPQKGSPRNGRQDGFAIHPH